MIVVLVLLYLALTYAIGIAGVEAAVKDGDITDPATAMLLICMSPVLAPVAVVCGVCRFVRRK